MKTHSTRRIAWGAIAVVSTGLVVLLAIAATAALAAPLALAGAIAAGLAAVTALVGVTVDRAPPVADATTTDEGPIAVAPRPASPLAEEDIVADTQDIEAEPVAISDTDAEIPIETEPTQEVMVAAAGSEIIEVRDGDSVTDVIVKSGDRTTSVDRIGNIIDAGDWEADQPPTDDEIAAALERWGPGATTGDAA